MNKPTFRCPNPAIIFVFGLLLISGVGTAAAEENPRLNRLNREARAAFQAVAPPQAIGCQSCALAHQKCFATCFADVDKGQMSACLTACANTAAACTCDAAATVRSEDLVEQGLVSITKAAACHGSVSCQPAYGSCASWSAYVTCGEPYCANQPHCGACNCDEFGICYCGFGPARNVPYERYRVCFDSSGNSCTEWQSLVVYTCGC